MREIIISQPPDLVRTTTQIATFKAGDKRTTTHQHLFLPKDYSGSPTTSIYTPWTESEVLSHLTTDWDRYYHWRPTRLQPTSSIYTPVL